MIDLGYVLPSGKNAGLTALESFHKQYDVVSSGCWEWNSKRFSNNYGAYYHKGSYLLAHRASYYIDRGFSPLNQVCHSCDNRSCVNPAHLFDGTQSENLQDMLRKNRHNPPRGAKSGKTKMTETDVSYIRESRLTQKELAKKFGVAPATISRIIGRKRWI